MYEIFLGEDFLTVVSLAYSSLFIGKHKCKLWKYYFKMSKVSIVICSVMSHRIKQRNFYN